MDEEELSSALASQYGPQLLLRVDAAPIREGPGVHVNPFRLTDEVILEGVESPGAYARFMARYTMARRFQSGEKPPFAWPDIERVSVPHVFVRARIEGSTRNVLLAICASMGEQTLARTMSALQDSKELVEYAEAFNKYLRSAAEAEGGGADEAPQVKISAPVGCRVLDSKIPQLTAAECYVVLFDCPQSDVVKLMLDGTEQFHELAQSFFHYVMWHSGGRTLPFDLQGMETGQSDLLLIDPCVLRNEGETKVSDECREEVFQSLHRTCGQLCKGFDPSRRGGKVRRVCGVPTCSLPMALHA